MPRSPTASAKGDLDSTDTEKPMVDEEEDDEDEVLETSENGRWQKINTPVWWSFTLIGYILVWGGEHQSSSV